MAYLLLLVGVSTAFTVAVTSRSAYDVNIGRVVGEPYSVLPGGQIANRLRFRVRNQTPQASSFSLEVLRPDGADVNVVGVQPVPLEPGEMKRLEAWIVIPIDAFAKESDAHVEGAFELSFSDGTSEVHSFMLIGPSQ